MLSSEHKRDHLACLELLLNTDSEMSHKPLVDIQKNIDSYDDKIIFE